MIILNPIMGWDLIHYGFFHFGKVWSKIAEEILKKQGVSIRNKIFLPQAIPSYFMNMKRVLLSDILKLTEKSPEFL